MRKYAVRFAVAAAALATLVVLADVLRIWTFREPFVGKFAGGDPDMVQSPANSETTPGEGPIGGWDAYLAAARAYPAGDVPPAAVAQAQATFDRIANDDAKKGDPKAKGHKF